ncbi:hypothetical protein MRS44_018304 [Fusarium solani]|uniref:uncharacterized protein n=1 Tax=Fusarium solani TaxID=169388 RepID=UPI0032C3F894|nr:hypothetical protein MRS44_018304 [Fusarium solani]
MSNPRDYTVGWICALATEYVAAQAFLDEKHEGPESVSTHDNNDYTLGRVGKHNVVIAVLPHGEYGISSAAGVAKDMLHSFPNVRIGLMVGIGGGAPSPKHDIRLGDVVVSASGNGKSGVFQYDFGKTIQNQEFQETGFLNQPPTVLRAAVNGLMAQYESEGHQFEESMNAIFEKKPRLRKKYSRPEQSTDRLYQPGMLHPQNDESSCATACGNDPSTVIMRVERTEDEDNPAIHYGLIASADRLMKDAMIRDILAAKKDVLCFEMEAAGLMNHFPCLVIRGICDYSDSHKNKDWQGYAAMTAAAYAKDLLYRIAPNRIEAEKKIREVISDVQVGIGELVQKQHDQEQESLMKWLTPIDYAPQQNYFFDRWQPGTGQWLLDTEEFQSWVKTRGQTLFCPGIPGAGKTILTSIVVKNLQDRSQNDPNMGIAYIYCNFQRQDEQTAEGLLMSLLKQLTRGRPTFPDGVKSLHDKHRNKQSRPSFDEISSILQSVAALYLRVFILIDALDECRVSDGSLTKFIVEVFKLQAKSGANVFATSRFIPEIPEIADTFENGISLEIRATEEDVRRYLDAHMLRLPAFVRRSPELQEEVKNGIVNSVQGMFLLAQLHLESLIGNTSVKAVRMALAKLPSGSDAYNHAYDTVMERIESQVAGHRKLAKQILSWITCAKRPLTTVELQHALAVEVGEMELDKDNLPGIECMVLVCAGLVTNDKQSGTIRLVHYTTQQYFDKSRETWFPNAEADITTTCVTYLSFDVFESGFCQTDEEFEERIRLNPFYDYSAHHWGNHAREAPTLCQEVISFLESDTKVESSSQALMAVKWPWTGEYSQNVPRQMTGLHLVAYFGIEEATNEFLSNDHELDLEDSLGRTPLSYAAANGHEAVVKLLLDKGADTESKDQNGQTPLSYAAANGHEAVVKLLLDKGADTESKDQNGQTPLSLAAWKGHKTVVELLLAKDDIGLNSKDTREGWTPLLGAIVYGHEGVVELLLAKDGIDPNSWEPRTYITPLSQAIIFGRKDMAKLLLRKDGVIPDFKDRFGRTPLSLAAERGAEEVVKLLLMNNRVDPDAKDDDFGQTPLSWAARVGMDTVAGILLAKDCVDPDSKDKYDQTPLWWAADSGHATVVRILLRNNRVNPDCRNTGGRTPLSIAATRGKAVVVKLLLAKDGVNSNSRDTEYSRTPLSWAAEKGHEEVVGLLLKNHGVDHEAKDKNGQTPLSLASKNGYAAVVELLLAKDDVNSNSRDTEYRTPLSWAAEKGHEEVVGLLLKNHGVDHEAKDKNGQTPLSLASKNGYAAVVELLLAKDDVNSNSRDTEYSRTPLSWAAEKGHEEVVGLLLKNHGVDHEAKDKNGQTPLSLASKNGYAAVVELLLAKDDVNSNSRDTEYRTPLSWAAEKGHEEVVGLLLQHDRLEPDSKDSRYGGTPLLWATRDGLEAVVRLLEDITHREPSDREFRLTPSRELRREAVVKLLLAKDDVNPNSKDSSGWSPLSWAAFLGNEVVVALMLTKDAIDVNSEDKYHRTPLWWAARNGHEMVVDLLLRNDGVDPDHKDSEGRTPLSIAAACGRSKVVKLLLTKDGVDLNSKDTDSRTPLCWAARNGHEAVVQLLDKGAGRL